MKQKNPSSFELYFSARRWLLAFSEKNSGFTLIELLVVIVIIGILASLTTANYQGMIQKARDVQVELFVDSVFDAALAHQASTAGKFGFGIGQFYGTIDYASTYAANDWDPVFSGNTDISFPEITNERCYGLLACKDGNFGVIGYGTSTSTADDNSGGVIIRGTNPVVTATLAWESTLSETAIETQFLCTNGYFEGYVMGSSNDLFLAGLANVMSSAECGIAGIDKSGYRGPIFYAT